LHTSYIFANPAKKEGASLLVTILEKSPFFHSHFLVSLNKSKVSRTIISEKGKEVFSVTYGGGEGAFPNPFVESKLKAKAATRKINVIGEIVEKYGQDS